MKTKICNVWTKHTAQLIVGFVILLVLYGSGCNTISPKLQDEYIRPGLSEGMCSVLDEYRQSIIPKTMIKEKIPGFSVALVDRNGILWTAGFGYTDYDSKTPVKTDTLFNIGSMSKTITAVATMIAVQDGLVELDVPIIEYWPQFSVNSRFEENPQRKITLRHLLSHTSGIVHVAPVGNSREPSYGSLEEHVQSISDTWLRHKVGKRFSYSGLGYDLVAYILQRQSGKPFAEYLENTVFSPLNMPTCSVDPEFIKRHPNRAIGHRSFVKQVPLAADIPWRGCGSVSANAKELANFVRFFLNGGVVAGQRTLDEELLETMYTPTKYNKFCGLGVWLTGLNDGLCVGHPGKGVGFLTDMSWLPEYGIGAVTLMNSEWSPSPGDTDDNIFSKLISKKLIEKSESYDIRLEGAPASLPLDPNTFTQFKPEWKKYIGTYKYIMSNVWKLNSSARIALNLGVTTTETHVRVFKKERYLYIDSGLFLEGFDGGRLDEYLPGLFFTPSGECLDLRGPKLTWQNFRIKKDR